MHCIKRIKKEKNIIILIDTEEALHESQHPLLIKTLSKVEMEGNFFNLIKNIYEKPQLISHFMVKN